MDSRVITQQLTALQEQLALRGGLQNITNRIHAAQNIKQILTENTSFVLNCSTPVNLSYFL